MTVVDLVADRLELMVPQRTVYRDSLPPSDEITSGYLWVYSAAPLPASVDLADSQTLRNVTVWVNSTFAAARPDVAASSAVWAAAEAAEALVGWRPAAGHWKPVPLDSQPPQKDDDAPATITFFVVSSWAFTYQP